MMPGPEPLQREPGLFLPALWRLILAGGVFVVVYGACNRFTATRSDVGTFVFAWERHIPFVREMVVPYWSLDLFFCGAFFLCRSRVELDLLTKRLVAVVLGSAVFFLLFPLQFAFPRPEPEGWTAPLFRVLYANDLPYNLAPSLHISLRSLVWAFYGAILTGWLRTSVKVWFILIGASTLLVWQHHVIDIASGFAMGWAVAAFIPDPRQSAVRNPSTTLALRYGIGAVACLAASAVWIGFAWPAFGLGIMTLAYFTGRPRLLGKENGTLSPAAEWCLLPVLVVSRFIQRRWLKRTPPMREITPGVLFGRRLTTAEAEELLADGPLAVLDLTAEANAPAPFRERAFYHNHQMLDLVRPEASHVQPAIDFIARQRERDGRRVYVHCQLGLQRSALVAAHWLVHSGHASDLESALVRIRESEPLAAV